MTNRAIKGILTGVLCMACVGLCACDARLDSSIINEQADYSIDIALPYATVTPPPAIQTSERALVIEEDGGVIVNDSSTLLSEQGANAQAQSNYKSLRQGNTGLAVQALQVRLRELGYLDAESSGLFDTDTENAVRRFEQTYGTMQTGVATADLQQRLFAPDAPYYDSEAYNKAVVSHYKELQRGDVGSEVYSLQQRLRNLGYPLVDLTGIYDNETANAIMLFYEAYGLSASEVANIALQRELYSENARAYVDDGKHDVSASDALSVMPEENVREIQQYLIDLGYLSGEADGRLEARTQIALKLFEEACGRLPSGTINDDVLARLRNANAPGFDVISSDYSNLLEGSSGDEVLRLQQRLVEMGFISGTPDGEYRSSTTQAIKLFQRTNALEETGVADIYTQTVLFASFALNVEGKALVAVAQDQAEEEPIRDEIEHTGIERLGVGSSGDGVLRLQQRLTELGYVSALTGMYDSSTSRAVSAFQQNVGCEADGIASTSLQALLYSSMAPRSGQSYHSSTQDYRALQLGDVGDEVYNLQKRLWEMGYLKKESIANSVSSFNQATGEAVRAAQAAAGYENPDNVASIEFQCLIFAKQGNAFKSD